MDLFFQLAAIAVFLSIFFHKVLLGRENARNKSRMAPEPQGALPIIGHLHLLGGSNQLLYRTLGAMADKHGPAFTIRLGSRRAFVVSSWEVAKECFTINDKALASRPTTVAAKHMGYNYAVFGFAPYSPFWREMRKIATLELLSNRRLEMLKHVRISEVDMGMRELYSLCYNNSSSPMLVELKQWFENLTLNVVVRMVAGKCYFGASAVCDDGEARRCQKAISQFFHLIGIFVVSDALPFLWWLDMQGHEKAMKKTAKELDDILEGWLKEHRQRRISGGNKREEDQDFIDVMLSLQEEGQLSTFQFDADTSIKSTCLALILGGSDTTAGTMTWAISLLLKHRDMLRKAQEELDFHVGQERAVDDSDIKNLVYLQAIIKETLRLYPAGPLLGPREAMNDCTIAGYHVPANTRLIVNVWKIQRDSRVWPDPSAFIPERFLTSHADTDVRGQQFELIPFGSGRRSCPGASFALQVLHLTLARFLHAFELTTPSNQQVDMTESPGLTIPKATPLDVLLKPRLPANVYALT
ncbi:Cytochrome P450 82A3 [Hibiscus syriacus]|uniref:Cytochrome P450 82A3 n=1 Tax=Hibiscus syriacus TaxID=106335 RepID=A0A6A2YBQ1_HIBSY|nr:xanthotoxin 5-hydroxylase CYP82C4-like [Hibiscus syriacus]KAE8675296.1 Cytochrome P450 82A3 [Hibiscus syriacus]